MDSSLLGWRRALWVDHFSSENAMPLTDSLIRTFKPTGKVVKLYDGGGLLLRISPLRKKNRQFTYSRQGKQTTAGPGSYPAVTPKEARKKTLELRKALAQGKDPVRVKSEAREQKPLRML